MLPTWFLVVITVGVAVMAIAMFVQLWLMVGVYVTVRGLNAKLSSVLDRQINPILNNAKSIMDRAQKQAEQLANTLEEIGETARAQVTKVDQVITEATDRVRLQLIRVDETMSDALVRFEKTTEYIQTSVIRPVKEMQAVLHGITQALQFILKRSRRNPDRITQDEELFI